MISESPNTPPSNPKENEYDRYELGQIVDRLNSLENFRVQLGTFFSTANLTALGIAFTSQKAGIVLIAAAILSLLILFDIRLRGENVAYYYRGMRLQRRLAPDDPETFLYITPSDLARDAQRIAALDTVEARKAALTKIRITWHSPFVTLPIIVVLGEVIVGLWLWLRWNWMLF